MLLRELKYSFRNLWKSPGFALTAILTLALGIGASTAVFTVVDSVILKPLSYRNSGQLVVIWEKVKYLASNTRPYVGPNARHEDYWTKHASAFRGICLLRTSTSGVSIGLDHPQLVGSIRAQPNLLKILEVSPFMGRDFVASDAIAGHDRIAIISYSIWQNLFHADPNVIGKTLHIASTPYQVIGVLPANFQFPKRSVLNSALSAQSTSAAPPVEILTPLVIDPTRSYSWNGDYGNYIALARLKPGVSVSQAEAQMNILQKEIVDQMPADERQLGQDTLLAYVQPLHDAIVGNSRRSLWMLLAAVIALVLIACVNLANAQLGRAVAREREAAVRAALGASAKQLLWSSLAENLLLAIIGGLVGILTAFDAISLFKRYAPVELPRMAEIHPNYTVLLFVGAIVVGCALFFGIMPALHFVRTDPQRALQQNSTRTQGSRQSRRLRLALIGIQVFGCTALLLIAGLFAKSLMSLLQTDRGFDTSNVVTAEVSLAGQAYAKDEQRAAFDDGVLNRLRTLPGVQSAALYSAMPLEGETWLDTIRRTDKHVDHPPLWNMRWVSTGYFQLMRERLIAGRFLEERDRDTCNAVISEASAKAGWPGEDPIGHHFTWWQKTCTVVGIMADSHTNSLKEAPVNMAYLPFRSNPPYATFLMVRSAQSPESLIPDVRRAIWDQDPEVTIARVKTLESQVKDSLAAERFQTYILMAFGTAALLLAMLGIYGILSYTVAGRTQEIGVRMALGATRQSIYSLTMSEAAVPVIIGLIAGWAASIAAEKLVQKLLYGVTGVDWSVTAIVVTLFAACAGAAAFLPAHRAAAIDPMQALRVE